MVLEGEVVLVSNDGEQRLVAGDMVGFRAGVPDGHYFQNRSTRDAVLLEVGTTAEAVDQTEYPDIDLRARSDGYFHRDGTPYRWRAERRTSWRSVTHAVAHPPRSAQPAAAIV